MPANVGTRRKLNPNLKKGYVAPPAEDHIILDEDQKKTRNEKKTSSTTLQQQTTNNTAPSVATSTSSTTPQQKKVRQPATNNVASFEKYEKQHEAFIKQMETFMKTFIDFEKERLVFMREQFGSKNVNTTTTTPPTTTTASSTTKKDTVKTTNTSSPVVNTTTSTTTPKKTTTNTVASKTNPTTTTTVPNTTTNVTPSSPTKQTKNTPKNKDPAVDASPTKQQTKKTEATVKNTTTTPTTTTATSSNTPTTTPTVPTTTVRELTIPKDDIFENLKVVYMTGETKKAIIEANKVFDKLSKKDAVYGIDVLWNVKEEKKVTETTGEFYHSVPIRYILLATNDTVFIYRPATAEEMIAEKIEKPLPVALYKIITQKSCVKISWNALDKITYLYHNLNNTYVSHVSNVNTLFKTEYNSAFDMLVKELDLPEEKLSKELKARQNFNYSKELNNGQLVTVAKRCWLEYRVVEKLAEKQEAKTSIFEFATKNMIIED